MAESKIKAKKSVAKKKVRKAGSGGVRPNSGPKSKYGEKTVNVTFRCPTTKEEEFKKYVNDKLKEWEIK